MQFIMQVILYGFRYGHKKRAVRVYNSLIFSQLDRGAQNRNITIFCIALLYCFTFVLWSIWGQAGDKMCNKHGANHACRLYQNVKPSCHTLKN